jgi:hypothetical protein
VNKSRLYTYLTGALLGLAAAVVYYLTRGADGSEWSKPLVLSLSGSAAFVVGWATQHVADAPGATVANATTAAKSSPTPPPPPDA